MVKEIDGDGGEGLTTPQKNNDEGILLLLLSFRVKILEKIQAYVLFW